MSHLTFNGKNSTSGQYEAALLALASRFYGVVLFAHVVLYVFRNRKNATQLARRLINRLIKQGFLLRLEPVRKMEFFAITPRGVVLAEDYGISVSCGMRWGVRKRGVPWAPPGAVQHDLRAFEFILAVELLHQQQPDLLAEMLKLPAELVRRPIATATEYELRRVTTKPAMVDPFASHRKRPDGLIRIGNITISVEAEGALKTGKSLRRLARSLIDVSQDEAYPMMMPTRSGGEIEVRPMVAVVVLPHVPPVEEQYCADMRLRVVRSVVEQLAEQLSRPNPADAPAIFRSTPLGLPRGLARLVFIQEQGVGTFCVKSTMAELTRYSDPKRWARPVTAT